jgi:hypothetical protein
MFKFICKYSGGVDGQLLAPVEAYVRATAPAATMEPQIYDALCEDCRGKDQKVKTRLALLKFGLIESLTVANCRSSIGDKELTIEKHITGFRDIVAQVDGLSQEPSVQAFIEAADCKIVGQFLKKSFLEFKPKFTKVEILVHQLLIELEDLTQSKFDLKDYVNCVEKPKNNKVTEASAATPSLCKHNR